MNMYIIALQISLFLTILPGSWQQDQDCCLPPISLLGLAEDLRDSNIFPSLEKNYFVVTAGVIQRVFQIPGVAQQLYLNSNEEYFPFVLVGYKEGLYFNTTITSANTAILPNPQLLPNSSGPIPLTLERSQIVFDCMGDFNHPIPVTVNITTYSNDTTFCQIVFSFGKICNIEDMLSSGDNNYRDFSMLGAINQNISLPPYGGCGNTTTSPPVPTEVIRNRNSGQVLLVVLSSVFSPVFTIIVIIAVVVSLVLAFWSYSVRKQKQQLELVSLARAYMDTRELWIPMEQDEGHECEFPVDQVNILRQLGEGAFSVVYEGTADGIEEEGVKSHVAIKQLRDLSASDDFFREVDFMSKLNHPNIVRLLGVCSRREPYYMIFEYMDLGDLCSFLRNAALLQLDNEEQEENLDMGDMVEIAVQVASGMDFIARNKYIHRDLAARNCLVSTGLVVKIADFGMSRNVYSTDYYRVQGSVVLPIRWMAPESIKYGKFSEATDIWSFGVLLWEITSLGQQPFTGYTNDEVIELISEGERLKPFIEAGPLASVMLDCWERKANKRPTFDEVLIHLNTIKNDLESAKNTQI